MTRSQYVSAVWEYEKRRNKLRVIYKRKDPVYGKKVKRITGKIKNWKETIRRIDKRSKLINNLIKNVNEYFSVDIKSKRMDNQHKLARSVYYKIGLEMNIRGSYISEYVGRSKKMAMRGRQSFTKSFKDNPANREIFYRFKKMIKQ